MPKDTVICRVKKSFTKVPAMLMDAVSYLEKIGELQRAMNAKKREAKRQIEAINADLTAQLSSLKRERDTFFVALFAYAQPRKAELTKEKRSVALQSGTFGWRFTPPMVAIRNGMSDSDAVHYFEKHGWNAYVRVVKEVDREALLAARPLIPIVSYLQREEFFAKPKPGKSDGRAEELTTEAIDV